MCMLLMKGNFHSTRILTKKKLPVFFLKWLSCGLGKESMTAVEYSCTSYFILMELKWWIKVTDTVISFTVLDFLTHFLPVRLHARFELSSRVIKYLRFCTYSLWNVWTHIFILIFSLQSNQDSIQTRRLSKNNAYFLILKLLWKLIRTSSTRLKKNMGHSKKNNKEDKEFANEHDRCVKLGSIALQGVYIWSFVEMVLSLFLYNNMSLLILVKIKCACEICSYR